MVKMLDHAFESGQNLDSSTCFDLFPKIHNKSCNLSVYPKEDALNALRFMLLTEVFHMFTPKISSTLMVLLCLVTVLLSSISTTIFSESSFNDHASISVTVLAVIGITLTAAKFIFDTIHNICNP